MKKIMFSIMLISIFLFAGCNSTDNSSLPEIAVTDFDSCVRAGNDIIKSVPRSCEFNETVFTQPTIAERCESEGGIWDYKFYDCEGVSEEYCKNFIGGTYEECGSGCRHKTNSTECTDECVQVCTLNMNQ